MELVELGQQARNEGRIGEALELYVSAADLLLEGEELVRWAHALRHVADLQLQQGRVEEARQSIEAVTVFYRTNGTGALEMANTLRIAALVEEVAGKNEVATDLWSEAADLYAECGVEAGVAEARRRRG